ncbi:MAG: ATP-binding protein [Rickettsiales bacterium]
MSPEAASGSADLFLLLPLAVLYIGKEGVVTDANPAMEALLKRPMREIIGNNLSSVLEDEALSRLVNETLFNGITTRIQQTEITIADEKLQATLHIAPLWEAGQESETSGAVIVIDPLQHAERFLRKKEQQEKSRTAGLAAAMLAHEIKNPLSSIRSAAQMIEDESNKDYTFLIIREVDRVAGMMQRMEYLSQDAPLALEAVNIHEVLRYAVSVISPELIRRIKVKEKFDPSLPPVSGDRDLLIQLFLNLIKNAAEALGTTPEANIILSTRCASDFRMMHGNKRTLPIYIDIEDNGPGFPSEVKTQLFTPFVSTKRGGNGLGMVIAAKIATDHGGAVEILETGQGRTIIRVILTSL